MKKLAEEFHKEEIASQWAGLLPEKLVQESFIKQLEALQSLDQLAPLIAVKEHLPGDIIDILELLGKADNIPFNQLYSLAEDCTDRCYARVIQTLTCLMKNSFHDRQLVLVNTARALKFLESYAACQTKLWKVLSKYHNLPDHFSQFKNNSSGWVWFIKDCNIEKHTKYPRGGSVKASIYNCTFWPYKYIIHQTGAPWQTSTDSIYPHPQSDVIQLNTPDYDPDIDRDPDPVTDAQPPNAKSDKDTSTDTLKSEDHTAIHLINNRPEHQPSEVLPDNNNEYDNVQQQWAEHPSDYCPQLEDILELETDEENWDDGQFGNAELLYNHNSTEESDRICREYSADFEKVEDQEYSPYHTAQGVEYYILEPDYYHTNTQPKQHQRQQNQNIYLPPPPSIEDLHTWYSRGRRRARHLELHGHKLYGWKTRSLESQLAWKCKKNQHLQEQRAVHT